LHYTAINLIHKEKFYFKFGSKDIKFIDTPYITQ